MQFIHDRILNCFILWRNDCNRGVFLDSVKQKVDHPGSRRVGQNRVQSRLNSQEAGSSQEDKNVEDENYVADLQQMTAAADKQRRYFRSIQNGATANRQSNSRANEET